MKVTFLVPSSVKERTPERLFGCNYGYFYQQNIFILYPATLLEKKGYEIKVIDAPVQKIWPKEFENVLLKDNSNVYAFYTVFLAEEIDKYWLNWIRKNKPNAYIVFFGPEPTARPEDFIADKNIFVVRGEAEHTFSELVREIDSKKRFEKILGLSWMKNNKVINNPPRPLLTNNQLDKLPFPARHLIRKDIYFNPKLSGRPSSVMLTSRNCFGKCIYCIPSSYTFAREIEYKKYFNCKPKVTSRSAKNVIEEFKLLKKQGYKSVAIIDDNFVDNKKRIIEICKGIKDLKIEWGCLARADVLDEDIIKAMASSDCVYVDLGVESLDQKILDYVGKGMKVERIENAVKLLKKYGINPKINILFGSSPLETKESVKETVEKMKKLDVDFVSFGIVIPHPQTEFYKIVKKNKWFATRSGDFEPVDPYKVATVDFPKLSHKELQNLVKWSYRSYYLRPSYILKRLKKIKTFQSLLENVKTAWNLFR
jgi:radical SAM superfamily enzyme YgiQ (UPF0313 family)